MTSFRSKSNSFTLLKTRWIRDQVWHRDQKKRFLPDGSMELTFRVADFSEIKMQVLRHGAQVEVFKPKGLREMIKAESEKISRIY